MDAKYQTPFKPFHLALCELIDAGLTNLKECARIGECHAETIRNWCNEKTSADELIAHRIMRNHPNPQVRRRLAEARVSGAEFFVGTSSGDTDIDRDGQTTVQDALMAAAAVVRDSSQTMDQLVRDSARGLNEAESQRVVDRLNAVLADVQRAIGAVTRAGANGRGFRPRVVG